MSGPRLDSVLAEHLNRTLSQVRSPSCNTEIEPPPVDNDLLSSASVGLLRQMRPLRIDSTTA